MMADKFQWATAEHLDRMDTIGARSFEHAGSSPLPEK